MTKRPKATVHEPTVTGAQFGLQGLAAFLLGGVSSLTLSMSPALWSEEPETSIVRFLGYMLGGAMGGAGMVWGYPKKGVVGAAALGFGVAFLAPAFLAASRMDTLMTMQASDYGTGTFLSAFFSYSISYGIAGGLGMAFTVPRLFWRSAWIFFASGGLGGLLAALGPALGDPGGPAAVYRILIFLLAGHFSAFTLGGYGAGKALEKDVRRALKRRR